MLKILGRDIIVKVNPKRSFGELFTASKFKWMPRCWQNASPETIGSFFSFRWEIDKPTITHFHFARMPQGIHDYEDFVRYLTHDSRYVQGHAGDLLTVSSIFPLMQTERQIISFASPCSDRESMPGDPGFLCINGTQIERRVRKVSFTELTHPPLVSNRPEFVALVKETRFK